MCNLNESKRIFFICLVATIFILEIHKMEESVIVSSVFLIQTFIRYDKKIEWK